MTLLTPGAELSLVSVVFPMTGDASCRQPVAIQIAGMTGVALDRRVCASQRVFCILVMAEMEHWPFAFAVAALTPRSIASGMNILDLMAIDARRPDPGVALPAVAGRTGDCPVRLVEWEFGRTVVEGFDAAPFGLVMALFAGFPQSALVRIASLVATDAASRRVAEFCRRCMTAAAGDRHMGVLQHEIRVGVVEDFSIELDDISIAPQMITVAAAAVLLCSIGPAAVISLSRRAVCGNVLVTGKAQVGL
jgi:hypothetical protein